MSYKLRAQKEICKQHCFTVRKNFVKRTNEKIKRKDLQTAKLEEKVQEMVDESKKQETKADGRTYSPEIHMMVFDAIVAQVPTYNITELITKISRRCGVTLKDVPRRSAIEFMTRELGVIAELQTAEVILDDHNITLGFDATTQEGVHVNSIHITTKTDAVRCTAWWDCRGLLLTHH